MELRMKEMAETLAVRIKILKGMGLYKDESVLKCKRWTELKAIEATLKTLGVPFEYTYDDDCRITAVTVAGITASV